MDFSQINQIVAVGSVDGVCTTAALLRLINDDCAETTPDVGAWMPNRKVAFVDLAVNNRDPQMTAKFLDRIEQGGHEVVAIIDEHSREDWSAMSMHGDFDRLIIQPQSQNVEGGPKSSGEVLHRALVSAGELSPEDRNPYVEELLFAAAQADRMDFNTRFGAIVNQAIKSNIGDDSRRVYLARHLAKTSSPDATIIGWIREYQVILECHDRIVADRKDLGGGIHKVLTRGWKVDMTTLMARLYAEGAKVVVLVGESFNKSEGRKTIQVSFGTNDKSLDLLAIIKAVVPSASGFAQKATVMPDEEEIATQAVRYALGG